MTNSRFIINGEPRVVSSNGMRLDLECPDGQHIELKLFGNDYLVDGLCIPKLSNREIAALWSIAKGSVVPNENGRPGWMLAEDLQMEPANISSRITSALEKMELAFYISRPTTKPKSTRPKTPEKAWYLNGASMRVALCILTSDFLNHHFSNIIWQGEEQKERTEELIEEHNRAYELAFTLAYLQKTIDNYEGREEQDTDQGSKPCRVSEQLSDNSDEPGLEVLFQD